MKKTYLMELGEEFYTPEGWVVCVGREEFEVHEVDDQGDTKLFFAPLSESDVLHLIEEAQDRNYDKVEYVDFDYIFKEMYNLVWDFCRHFGKDEDIEQFSDEFANLTLPTFTEITEQMGIFFQMLEEKDLQIYWDIDYAREYERLRKKLRWICINYYDPNRS